MLPSVCAAHLQVQVGQLGDTSSGKADLLSSARIWQVAWLQAFSSLPSILGSCFCVSTAGSELFKNPNPPLQLLAKAVVIEGS